MIETRAAVGRVKRREVLKVLTTKMTRINWRKGEQGVDGGMAGLI
jgi:hypothetical protein